MIHLHKLLENLKKFGVKFPACKKTLYKWIYLNLLELNKQNLRHHGKKYKRKGKTENRGKLDDKFKSIWDIKDKDTNVVFFEMDTVDEKISVAITESEEKVDQKIIALEEKHREENSKNLIEITNAIDEK